MITLAARSGSTCSCSISVSSATTFAGRIPARLRHRQRDLHRRRIERLRDRGADIVVDRRGDALGGGEIGVAQREPQLINLVEREFDLALDDGSIGDPADGRHPAGDLGGVAFDLKAPDRQRALGDRVHIAVGAQERRDQQRAALQAFGVAERGRRHVDAGALGAERRQVGGYHDGRHIAGADGLAADIDAEPLQHGLQRLLGERNVVERVAGAVEADHQAISDQLVLPHPLDIGEVLDARGGIRPRAGTDRQKGREKRGRNRPRHPLLPS
jgi:hypothetical protein